MARENKVGVAIQFKVRCGGDPTTENPTVVVLDEADAVFATLTLGSGITQLGSTRIVSGSFTPDADGQWTLQATDDTGLDLVKSYDVGQHSIVSIGAQVATNEAKIDVVDTEVGVVDGKVDVVDTKVDALGLDVDAVDGKVDALATQLGVADGNIATVLAAVQALQSGGGGHFG